MKLVHCTNRSSRQHSDRVSIPSIQSSMKRWYHHESWSEHIIVMAKWLGYLKLTRASICSHLVSWRRIREPTVFFHRILIGFCGVEFSLSLRKKPTRVTEMRIYRGSWTCKYLPSVSPASCPASGSNLMIVIVKWTAVYRKQVSWTTPTSGDQP